jgi:hypothetical protein
LELPAKSMMGFGLKMHTVAVKLAQLADGVYYSDPVQLAQTSRPPIQVLLGWVKSLRGKINEKGQQQQFLHAIKNFGPANHHVPQKILSSLLWEKHGSNFP